MEDDLRRVERELGIARRSSGLSLQAVGVACGVSVSTAWRVEEGRTRNPDLLLLASMAAAAGRELGLQIYLSGEPIRDAGQQRLLERLRARIHPGLHWATEVPLPIPGDARAWDALIRGAEWRIGVDAETVIDDVQAVERRAILKMRDGGVDHVLLLVADTRRNRRALAAAPAAFAGFSRDARSVLAALREGRPPSGSSIVFL
jgi:transcriptional regulator with XRE-family HTH domain